MFGYVNVLTLKGAIFTDSSQKQRGRQVDLNPCGPLPPALYICLKSDNSGRTRLGMSFANWQPQGRGKMRQLLSGSVLSKIMSVRVHMHRMGDISASARKINSFRRHLSSECKEGASGNEKANTGGTNASQTKGAVTTTVERTGRNAGGGSRGGCASQRGRVRGQGCRSRETRAVRE